jgi:hypothetical protein
MTSFCYNIDSVNEIVKLLISYQNDKDKNLLLKIKNMVGDDKVILDYDNYYTEYIKTNRDMFFEYSKGHDNIELWCKLVYKIYDDPDSY